MAKPVKDTSEKVLRRPALLPVMVRLRWQLFLRTFRKNWPQTIGMSIGILYALGAIWGLGFMMLGLGFTPQSELATLHPQLNHGSLLALLGTGAMTAWLILPLLTFGISNALDPKHFATFQHGPKALLKPIFVASLVSPTFILSTLAVLVVAVGALIWLINDAQTTGIPYLASSPVFALLAAVLLIPCWLFAQLLGALLPQVLLTWRSTLRLGKRQKEMLTVVSLVVILGGFYGLNLFFSASGSEDRLGLNLDSGINFALGAAQILQWTPLGAPFAVPLDLAAGNVLGAVLKLAITVLAFALLWKLWGKVFTRAQEQALQGVAAAKDTKVTALVPSILPQNQLGAVAGRSLKYWRRDTRYGGSFLIMPLIVIFLVGMAVVNPNLATNAYIAMFMTAWLVGIMIGNEVGFDGPSGWVNITAGINNKANLLGRYLAMALFMIPWLLAVQIGVPLLLGKSELILFSVPLSLGFVLSTWGISMLVTAFLPYPAPAPGVMKNSGSNGAAIPALLVIMLLVWLPLIPSMVLVLIGFSFVPGLEYAGIALMLVLGGLIFWGGLHFAAKHLDARYPDEWQKVKAFAGK